MNQKTELFQPGENITPKISVDECKILINKLYGLKVKSIIELNGYDDKNYNIIVDEYYKNKYISKISRNGYVFKILNKLDSTKSDFIEAQKEMMLFLGRNNIRCSEPVQNKLGEYYSLEKIEGSGNHIVRLLKYIPGEIFYNVPATPELFYNAGEYLANIDLALQNFYHKAYKTHQSLWMLESVSELRQYMHVIKNHEDIKMIEEIIIEFEEKVLRQMEVLEKGCIHGDYNEHNILVNKNQNGSWIVDAILDFGDTQYSCLLFEIGVAVTYMVIQAKDIKMAKYFLAGFSNVRPISDFEYNLLKNCVAARFCQTLVLGAYNSTLHPDNKYISITQANGWNLLRQLWKIPNEILIEEWKTITH